MNFAPTFPFWDVLFGTFYMPAGKLPENYGIEDPTFPAGFAAQLIYPFRGEATREPLTTTDAAANSSAISVGRQ